MLKALHRGGCRAWCHVDREVRDISGFRAGPFVIDDVAPAVVQADLPLPREWHPLERVDPLGDQVQAPSQPAHPREEDHQGHPVPRAGRS